MRPGSGWSMPRALSAFVRGAPELPSNRALLEEEGVVFDEEGRIDLKSYGWEGLDLAELTHLESEPRNVTCSRAVYHLED